MRPEVSTGREETPLLNQLHGQRPPTGYEIAKTTEEILSLINLFSSLLDRFNASIVENYRSYLRVLARAVNST
jgi:hypothetical protein